MGADNWTKCPKCLRKQKDKQAKLNQKLKDEYGKIPLNEWKALEHKVQEPFKVEKVLCLREDYQIEIDEIGCFSVKYSCRCNQCGFEFKYEYTKATM